jgi:predicted ribosomally synthesized peptide with nif11-like leader
MNGHNAMSLQQAFQFIQKTARQPAMRNRIRALGPEATLAQLAALGSASGFQFTEAEIRAAFLLDWRIRRRYYGRPSLDDSGRNGWR